MRENLVPMAPLPSAPAAPACSMLSQAADEPAAGTAAVAVTWLCVEQPGPWGREALLESRMDPGVGAELAARARAGGVRVVLIRRPGARPRPGAPRRVFLAHTRPGRARLRAATVGDPAQLLGLDFAAVGAGVLGGFGGPAPGPLLLVCTNGRRDVCCAVRGRPLAAALAAEHGQAVWECTHLGGHRFAPTALLLPTGYAYGRLDLPRAGALLAGDAGRVALAGCRGRSTWGPPGQAAELAVRELTHTLDPDALAVRDPVSEGDGEWRVVVTHADGRSWRVTVVERAVGPDRPASCGVSPTPAVVPVVTRID